MSNPYGNDPYGNQGGGGNPYGTPQGGNPYGAPQGSPYGAPQAGGGYGQYPGNPYGGGAGGGEPAMDAVSLTGFILSLVCCGPVGLVLGIIGLSRTKGGRRRGRWAAVAAIVVGVLTTIGVVVGAVLLGNVVASFKTPSNAEVGDCVDFQDETDDAVTMRAKECSEPHDAEIVHQGDFTSALIEDYSGDDTGAFCMDLASDEYVEAIRSGPYTGGVIVEADDPDRPEEGDAFVCYVEREDGEKLEGSVAD